MEHNEQNNAEETTPTHSEVTTQEQTQAQDVDTDSQTANESQSAGTAETGGETPPATPAQPGRGGGEDFGQMFEESMRSVQPGEIVRGRVVNIGPEFVTIDIGYKSEGHIPLAEFRQRDGQLTVSEGDELEVYFDSADSDQEGIVLSRAKAEQFRIWRDIEEAFNSHTPVDGSIVGKVKGGLRVDIGVAAFLPGSHVDIRPIRDLDQFLGKTGKFAILKYNRARSNVVVSRRAVLEQERTALREETLKVLEEGVIIEGTVKNITDYGAFVDLGGLDGLLHITDMSWGRIGHPSEMIKAGETLKVVVLKFDVEKERVSLGLKQLVPDPWGSVTERYLPGSRVQGKVVSLADYGAFVELEQGVEGLLHVSEMSWTKRISHPSKLLSVGDEVEIVVLDLDPAHRRISLGLKQVSPNPWETVRATHPVGSRIHGKVKSITDFGVFIEVEEGIDGLAHISDLHWTRKIKHPSELFKKGDEVDAVILGIDVDNERISLGIKQSAADPWVTLQQEHPVGSRINGKVTSVTDFGVFVEVADGIEGLVHISQLSTERVEKPSALFEVGNTVEAEVIHIDPREHKMGLSVKALRRSEERAEMEAYLQREREGARFSFEDILGEELRLDRDDDPQKS
ncbi:MAG: 30S ribosomal protein S1 [Desulfurellaceae bacterium]|nr:30S ribosomal protein S1 [Desulfurellaceae bacterium]